MATHISDDPVDGKRIRIRVMRCAAVLGMVVAGAAVASLGQTVKEYIRLGGRVVAIETGVPANGGTAQGEASDPAAAKPGDESVVGFGLSSTDRAAGGQLSGTAECLSDANFDCTNIVPFKLTTDGALVEGGLKFRLKPGLTAGTKPLTVYFRQGSNVASRIVNVPVVTQNLVAPRDQVMVASMSQIFRTSGPANWSISSQPDPSFAGNLIAPGIGSGQTIANQSEVTYQPGIVTRKQTVTLTVTQGSFTDSVKITVLPMKINLFDPLSHSTVPSGGMRQIYASVTPVLQGLSQAVTWSVRTDAASGSSSAPADAGVISSTGLYTAPQTAQSKTIVITALGQGGFGSVNISLVISAKALTMMPEAITMLAGEVRAFQAASQATNNGSLNLPDVNWSLSPNLGTIAPNDAVGRNNPSFYTAPVNVSSSGASVSVQATTKVSPIVTDAATVTILQNPNAQVTLKPPTVPSTVSAGQDLELLFGESNPNSAVDDTYILFTPIERPDGDITAADQAAGCSLWFDHYVTNATSYSVFLDDASPGSALNSGTGYPGVNADGSGNRRLSNARCSVLLQSGSTVKTKAEDIVGANGLEKNLNVFVNFTPMLATRLYVYQKVRTTYAAGGTGWVYRGPVIVQGTAPSFQLNVLQSPSGIVAGQTGSYQIAVVPRNGFTGNVQLTCVTPPASVSCNAPTAAANGVAALNVTANLAPGDSTSVLVRGTGSGAGGATILAETLIGVRAPGDPAGNGTGRSAQFAQDQKASYDFTGVSGFANRNEWRTEFRLHNPPSQGTTRIATWYSPTATGWVYMYTQNTMLALVMSDGSSTATHYYEYGANTDLLVRLQRKPTAPGATPGIWETFAWKVNGGVPTELTLTYSTGTNYSNITESFAKPFTVGASPNSSDKLSGNLGFFRLYPNATNATTAPGNSAESGAMMAFEFENDLRDSAQPSRLLTSELGTIPFVNTPAGGGPPPPPSFQLNATPTAQAVIQGTTSASTSIAVTPINAFGTTTGVALDCVSPPSGITCGTGTATVAQAGSIAINLPAGLAGGVYTINVRGTGGGYTSTIPVNVQVLVPSFSLASSPAAATVVTGTPAAVLGISVNATGGFSHSTPVTLTCPSAPAGISCAAATATGAQFANLGVTLPSGLPNGIYNLTVQGTGGGLTRTVMVPIQVAPPGNYSLGLSPSSATIARGTPSAATTVSVIGTGGWPSGLSVVLTCPNAPGGITCSGATATGAQSAALTLTVPSTIPAGNYTINVSGNGGGVVQTASYGLTVTSSRSLNLPGSQAPYLNLTGTSNLASLTQWRMEFRMHGYASTSTYSGVFEIGAFPNANAWGFLSSGTLWLIAQDSTGKRTSTSTYVGGVTDVVARIQRDGSGWNFSVWSYNGGNPVLLTTTISYGPEVPAVPDNLAQMLTLGSFGYSSSTPMSGNFAYFRIYPTAVGATTAPLNALQIGALMAFEFDDSLVDTAVPSRSLTPAGSGSISYTNTPQ